MFTTVPKKLKLKTTGVELFFSGTEIVELPTGGH